MSLAAESVPAATTPPHLSVCSRRPRLTAGATALRVLKWPRARLTVLGDRPQRRTGHNVKIWKAGTSQGDQVELSSRQRKGLAAVCSTAKLQPSIPLGYTCMTAQCTELHGKESEWVLLIS